MNDQEIRSCLNAMQATATKLSEEIYGRSFDHGARPAFAKHVDDILAAIRAAKHSHIPQAEGDLTADECRARIVEARVAFERTETTEAWATLDRAKALARARYPDEFP